MSAPNPAAGDSSTAAWRSLRRNWAEPVRVALDLVLPRPCPGCGGPDAWCAACAGTLAVRPRLVRLPEATLDRAAGRPLPPVRSLTRYTGPARAAILAGKERGRSDLPPLLGAALGRALARLQQLAVIDPEVWIVPAPSRRSAARRRGGDPVTAMARAAATVMAARGSAVGVAPCLHTGGRARDSVGLDSAARAANLSGRVRFRARAQPPPGAAVILIDDVVTTGATVLAAVHRLADAGIPAAAVLTLATAAPWSRM